MPFVAKKTGVIATSRGTYNTKKKTFTGKGPAPAGMRKVRPKKASEVPTVTTSSTGEVTTSGFASPASASKAKVRSKRSRQRVRRIVAASEAGDRRARRQLAASKPPPSPTSKPEVFKGRKTAGTPTLAELRKAESTGKLRVNRKGYATTPRVRRAGEDLREAQRLAQQAAGASDLPFLDEEGDRVATKVLRTGKRGGATRKELLAAAMTGLVESGGFHNLPEGDADSEGWRQERTSIYGTGPSGPRNVKAGARRFFEESISDTGGTRGAGMSAGQLAQTIQASAYPERYDERAGEAKAILRAFERGGMSRGERRKVKVAERRARAVGLRPSQPAQPAKIPKQVMTRFKAGLTAAKQLERADLPYVWGGGHGDPASRPTGGGLDCSGAVSYVLNKMGAMKGSLVSGEMGSVLEPGPGAVTVFYNPTHTFMRIGKKYFGTSATNEGGGAGFIEGTPDDLSKYSVGHVPGMGKKIAVRMGIPLTGGGSFPGMTLSSGGTTAVIDEGAAATITGKHPGFSAKPIQSTIAQRGRRVLNKLERLGAGVGKRDEDEEDSQPVLSALERRYGKAAV